MPRMKIVRAADGSEAVKFKQGEDNTNIEVKCTYESGLKFDDQDEQLIWETATGGKDLHNSKKVKNLPADAEGYIHVYGTNTLWAVGRLDTRKHTIEVIAEGKVNGGKHVF